MSGDDSSQDLTQWLKRMSAGEDQAANMVASAVYEELRRLAASALGGEYRHHSLQPTQLVNEAFLRLLKSEPIDWQDRSHFFTLASRMMRRIVIDYFRDRRAQKRPPQEFRFSLEDVIAFSEDRRDEALMVDEALNQLGEVDARAAKVVELRYFGGLTVTQAAEILGITDRTVKRDWDMARWWLKRYFEEEGRAAGA